MAPNWRKAWFDQAGEDFGVYQNICSVPGIKECYPIHFLQMALEKLLKGLQSDGREPPDPKHDASEKFFKDIKNLSNISEALDCKSHKDFVNFIGGLRNIIEQLEMYVPSGTKQRENAEYPWETRSLSAGGNIQVDVRIPANHTFNFMSRRAELDDLIKFINECLEAYRSGKL